MPIEIKEVIIKTTVEKEPHSTESYDLQIKQLEDMKKDVLRSCEQMINKIIKSQARR